jgi:DNA-binding response OmpR family regulator
MINVLVVDSNLTYARKISDFLLKHVKEVEVDLAHNVFILRDRLAKKKYNLILADVVASARPGELMDELALHEIPVVSWSLSGSVGELRDRMACNNCRTVLRKPFSQEEIRATLSGCFQSINA